MHYEGQAWHIELDRPEQGFQSIGSRAVMGKELLCQIAVLEQQAGGISEELSNLRAQCLREAADAAFAEYSCTVVEQLEAFSPQLA